MNNRLLLCYLASLGLLISTAQAQQWTFGPKVRLPLSLNVDLKSVSTNQSNLDLGGINESLPGQWAAFARYDRPHFFAQVDGFTGRFNVGTYVQDARGGSSFEFQSRLIGSSLVAGVKPSPWLRLYGGAGYQHHNWQANRLGNFGETADRFEESLTKGGLSASQAEAFQSELRRYRLLEATNNAYREHVLTGQVGAGIDIGGLTVDLAYTHSLTLLLRDIPTADGPLTARQGYSSYVLSFGYRLFPIKTFLAAPRKNNRAYQRIKRDIPFYRNEIHMAGGLVGEDIGSAFTYENRYTHYFTRRFGVMGGLNVTRVFETFDTGFLPKHYNTFQLVTALRVLPLYSRRHVIGISAGPTLTRETGVTASSGGTGRPYTYVNWRADSRRDGTALNWMSMIDYQFAATDRIVVGPWLRINGLDYATAGIQAGYRF